MMATLLLTAGVLFCRWLPAAPTEHGTALSFVESAQIVSRPATEQYAHQSTMRIVQGVAYVAYQCNETTPAENAPGQKVRLAIFDIAHPAATVRWVDVCGPGDASNGITITGRFVASPIVHVVNERTLRIFFVSKQAGDETSQQRIYFKDYDAKAGKFLPLQQVKCTIANTPDRPVDLTMPNVQKHLDFLFGEAFGAQFSKGISPGGDIVPIDGQLYSTVQIKQSESGKTLYLMNVLMRTADQGATWELLGAPDPRLIPGTKDGEVRILAEPALTYDRDQIYLHLRSNRIDCGYLLSKASRKNLWAFDPPVKKWTYGIGRPAICDFGPPIGLVAMFTAQSVPTGPVTLTRNKSDVVLIDPASENYRLAFSIVDKDAINTPFMCKYQDEVYVSYSTGRRRLIPKFGTSEIVFTKFRREFFTPAK